MSEKPMELTTKLIVGHKRDGRCVYSKQAKRELVEVCLRPGVSVARMALRNGVNANLLRKWITEHQAKRSAQANASQEAQLVAAKLLPVLEAKHPVVSEAATVEAGGQAANGGCIEIVLAQFTVRVRGPVDSRQLCVVMDCLTRRT